MPIRKYNPTSPGMRGKTSLTFDEITTNEPYAPLTESLHRSGGRNNQGELTLVVAAARAVQRLGQRGVRLVGRDLVEGQRRLAAHPRRGRVVFANRHALASLLRALQDLGELLPVPQLHRS